MLWGRLDLPEGKPGEFNAIGASLVHQMVAEDRRYIELGLDLPAEERLT